MNKITRLSMGKGRDKRVNVFVDGKFSFSLLAEVVVQEALKVGQALSESRIEELLGTDRYRRCYNAAVRYLSYRPRSESEIRQRLQRHGYDYDCIERTVVVLKERGLVDDTAFARFWIENRETFSPRSRRLTGLELQRKGLDRHVIEQTTGIIDDREGAYRAGLKKASRLPSADYVLFRRRLGDFLRRKGFGYEVINETVDRLWKERNSQVVHG
jgi:regulatory protein